MAIKYSAHFVHNDDIQCLDNVPYSEKFIRISFVQEGLRRLLSLSVCSFNSKLPKHNKCRCIIMTAS